MISIPAIIAAGKAWIAPAIKFIVTNAPILIKNTWAFISKNIFNLLYLGQFIPKTASIPKIKEVNNEFTNLVTKYSNETKPLEAMGKDLLKNYSNIIKDSILNISKETEIPDYIIKNLDFETSKLINNLNNFYEKEIGNKFSFNNEKLLDILKQDTSEEKKIDLENFAKDSLESSHDNLFKQVKLFSEKQYILIINELMKLKESQINEATIMEKELNDIKNNYENKQAKELLINNYNSILYKLEKL